MANLHSLPKESRPGEGYNRLPYALMRCGYKNRKHHTGNGCELLKFNAPATRMADFQRGEKVNLFWDSENFLIGIFRHGNQRKVTLWGDNSSWATIHITALIRLYQIPFHRHPLPVSCDPDGNVWIDFSGEVADVKYLPPNIRPKEPDINFKEARIARLCVKLSDDSSISNKTWPTLAELFKEISKAEGSPNFSRWVENVLTYHVQDHYPQLWETFLEQNSNGNKR